MSSCSKASNEIMSTFPAARFSNHSWSVALSCWSFSNSMICFQDASNVFQAASGTNTSVFSPLESTTYRAVAIACVTI